MLATPMHDPFRPNSNAQLIREAQIGLVLVAIFFGLFVYVAYYRLTGMGNKIPEHVRLAPVAESVWPNSHDDEDEPIASDSFQVTKSPAATWGKTPAAMPQPLKRQPRDLGSIDNQNRQQQPLPLASLSPSYGERTAGTRDIPLEAKQVLQTNYEDEIQANRFQPAAPPVQSRPPQPPLTSVASQRDIVLAQTFHSQTESGLRSEFTDQDFKTRELAKPDLKRRIEKQADFAPSESAETTPRVASLALEQSQTHFRKNVSLADGNPAMVDQGRSPNTILHAVRPGAPEAVTAPAMTPPNDFAVPPTQIAPRPQYVNALRQPTASNDLENKELIAHESDFNQERSETVSNQNNAVRPPKSNDFIGHASDTARTVEGNSDLANSPQEQHSYDDRLNPPTVTPSIDVNTQEAESDADIPQIAGPNHQDEHTYIVQAGDSFWSIAQQRYQDGSYFRALYRYNQTRVQDFNALIPGTTIDTPTAEQLTRDYPELCPANDFSLQTTSHSSGRWYSTEAGDTLFEIARQHLGQASRYLEILQLNEVRLPADVGHLSPLPGGLQLELPTSE